VVPFFHVWTLESDDGKRFLLCPLNWGFVLSQLFMHMRVALESSSAQLFFPLLSFLVVFGTLGICMRSSVSLMPV